eukprot:ANDGO_05231.mRNA.1 hypothetical protein
MLYYWGSVLYTALEARFMKRCSIFDDAVISRRVNPLTIDMNLHMNNMYYLHACEIVRWNWSIRSGMADMWKEKEWAPMIAGVSFRFRRQLRAFQKYDIRARMVGLDSKWMYVEHTLTSGNLFIGKGIARLCMVDTKSGKAVQSERVLAALGFSEDEIKNHMKELDAAKVHPVHTFASHDAHLDHKAEEQ